MGLIDGDDFVSGDIFSYQEANRIKNNWRAASAPSNPQPGSLFSDSDNEKLYHRQAAVYKELVQIDTQADGYIDLVLLSTLAAGGFALRIDAYQDDVTGLTGLLRGAYIQASNGDQAATGTIRALELKARAGRPGEAGNNVAVLEGLSISADAKTYDITTVMRGAEVILDGGAGSEITKAVGIRIAQNFQADIATLCYGIEFYRDSFDYDADIALSSGGLIGGNAGHLRLTDAGVLELYEDAMIDKLFLYHNGTDAYIKWSDGGLYLQTDEGDNTNTIVEMRGKGTGIGFFRARDQDNAEYLQFYCSEGIGIIQTAGISPNILALQYNTAQNIICWHTITSGNPSFYIYGYMTAVGVKYGRFYVDTGGTFIIEAQNMGKAYGSGSAIFSWQDSRLRIYDDNMITFGIDSDICMGYMNTGDIWHLCDQATLGSNIRMSVNGTGLSFFGVAPVAKAAHIADTAGDDAAVVNAILVVLENLGLVATV